MGRACFGAVAMERDCERLTNATRFNEVWQGRAGFVVIRDAARDRPNRMHRPGCPTVTRDHFIETVETHHEATGDYYFCHDRDAALALARGRWDYGRDYGNAGECSSCTAAP